MALAILPEPIIYTAPPESPRVVLIEEYIDWDKERVIEEINTVFPDAPIMVAVARCESTFIPDAANPHSTARGIFQIMQSIHGERMEETLKKVLSNPFSFQ